MIEDGKNAAFTECWEGPLKPELDLTKEETAVILYEILQEEEISESIAVYLEDCISGTKYRELKNSAIAKLKAYIKNNKQKKTVEKCNGCALERHDYLCRPLNSKSCNELRFKPI